ncbi:MAG: hypothetical protein AAFQ43_01190 [Bacteroidota bacterium]
MLKRTKQAIRSFTTWRYALGTIPHVAVTTAVCVLLFVVGGAVFGMLNASWLGVGFAFGLWSSAAELAEKKRLQKAQRD